MEQVPQRYGLRFSEEHLFRFLKQDLLWLVVHVRTPEQFLRWSWIVALAFLQLYLARPLGLSALLPWEAKGRPVTPRQVRRVMPTLLSQLGTPVRVCQPRGKAPASLLNLLAPFFPNNDPSPAPAFVVYGSVALGVLGLIAAFGLFKLKRWSMWLAILVSALSAFLGVGGTVSAGLPWVKGAGVLLAVLGVLIIALVIFSSVRRGYVAERMREVS